MTDGDRERFSDIVENALAIESRHQFFAWTQSSLQSLLPHEILVCGVDDGTSPGMAMHRFSASRYFRDEHFDAVSDPLNGLRSRLAAQPQGPRGTVLCAGAPGGEAAGLAALVRTSELKNLAAQLVRGVSGKVVALYAFARVSAPLDDRLGHLLELLVPHVHGAFLRVLANERAIAGMASRGASRVVTPRQAQILGLIKQGKTNVEIARLLDCSPWTIKNHIQAILRRLESNSRSHALSRAMSLGILTPD